MDLRKTIYKLGTIQSFQSQGLLNLKNVPKNAEGFPKIAYHSQLSSSVSQQKQSSKISQRRQVTQVSTYPLKHHMIKKPAKGKQKKIDDASKQKQTLLYSYFKRKIFTTTNKIENYIQSQRNFDFLKIVDWLMGACENLRLSKTAFYTAVAIGKKFYSRQTNRMFGANIIESQVGSMMSLAAKMQSNKINYPEAISLICGFKKAQIIDGQIFIMKMMNYKIPLVNVQTILVQISIQWQNFINENAMLIKFNTENISFGQTCLVKNWCRIGKLNYCHLCSIFDMIALPLHKKYDLENVQVASAIVLQALFLLINCKNRDFFPTATSQKTYTLLIFENFIKAKMNLSSDQIIDWTLSLIRNEQRLKLIQKVYKYLSAFSDKLLESKEDHSLSNTKTCEEDPNQYNYSRQIYCKIAVE